MIHNHLSHLYRSLGDLVNAKQEVEAALGIIESQRANVLSQDLRTSYFATVRSTYEFYIDILMQMHRQNPSAGFDKEAFGVSEKARARSFLRSSVTGILTPPRLPRKFRRAGMILCRRFVPTRFRDW